MKARKIFAILSAAMMIGTMQTSVVLAEENTATAAAAQEEVTAPKYIFLFIGDGMSYPQIQSANYYLSAS